MRTIKRICIDERISLLCQHTDWTRNYPVCQVWRDVPYLHLMNRHLRVSAEQRREYRTLILHGVASISPAVAGSSFLWKHTVYKRRENKEPNYVCGSKGLRRFNKGMRYVWTLCGQADQSRTNESLEAACRAVAGEVYILSFPPSPPLVFSLSALAAQPP